MQVCVDMFFDKFFLLSRLSTDFYDRLHVVRLAICWQAGATDCQPISYHLPQNFRIRKALWIINFNVG